MHQSYSFFFQIIFVKISDIIFFKLYYFKTIQSFWDHFSFGFFFIYISEYFGYNL